MYLLILEILILCSEINVYFNNYNKYLLLRFKKIKKYGIVRVEDYQSIVFIIERVQNQLLILMLTANQMFLIDYIKLIQI